MAFIEREAGIKLHGRHEFTVASGRVDSVYQRVIIEYKNPSSPSNRIGPKPTSPGTKKVVEQIKKRFYDLCKEQGQPLNSLFGVGLDGNRFIFVRFRDDKWQVQDPVEVSKHSTERFLCCNRSPASTTKPRCSSSCAGPKAGPPAARRIFPRPPSSRLRSRAATRPSTEAWSSSLCSSRTCASLLSKGCSARARP